MKRLTATIFVASFLIGVPATAGEIHHHHRRPGCRRLFTVSMDQRAARAVYWGTRTVTKANLRLLGRLERCQRNPRARWFVRWYNHHQAGLHDQRVYDAEHPWMGPDQASWFDDTGETACGIHAAYGFATLDASIPCGATIWMKGPNGQPVQAVHEDSGPYVGGRRWDLNPGLRDALGCGDICDVYWHR